MEPMLRFGLALLFISNVSGSPTPLTRQSITTLSQSTVNAFTPYSYFASAGYCSPESTLAWDCGANCDANSDFIPTASGGNGDSVQFWFVGYSPSLSSVIVSHQGTDPSEILSLLTDAEVIRGSLNSTLFPGISSSITVHEGFRDAQADTAESVLAAVQNTMTAHSATKVTIVGHSLGAAIGLIDSVYLPLHISDATFDFVGYGMPRVGNQDFADYVDSNSPSVTHINNKEDYIPILPGIGLGYHHPSGEVHIIDSGSWDSCPGQDNDSDLCTTGDVPSIFVGDESEHDGPYGPVTMGC